MPRLSIYQANGNAEGWSEPRDYCGRCYPKSLRTAAARTGADESDIDLHTEHPDYTLDSYTCESCGRTLEDRDN